MFVSTARKVAAPEAPPTRDVATGPQIPIAGPVRLVWAVTPEGLHCHWVWVGGASQASRLS